VLVSADTLLDSHHEPAMLRLSIAVFALAALALLLLAARLRFFVPSRRPAPVRFGRVRDLSWPQLRAR
jgi:regulator of protease activity HflC (stomatin/prohibitin superfamily)